MDTIDLNADVGEMDPDLDARIVQVVTSVSIACGGHAGDDTSMSQVASLASAAGVRIGAHPSYPDRENFGRTRVHLAPQDLTAQVRDQILRLAANSTGPVEYVKPHGALYHASATDMTVARSLVCAVLEAAEHLSRPLALMAQPRALSLDVAGAEALPTITEGFADRAYRGDGGLVPRHEPGAVLIDRGAVIEQVAGLARGEVVSTDGRIVAVRAQSVCVHSDTPGAADLVRRIRAHLDSSGIVVRATS